MSTQEAACPRCGGWTTFGGMSQHASCTCHEVYPITRFFEQATAKLNLGPCGKQVISLMASTLGEYEHGTAEPEDVFQGVQGFDLSDVDDRDERRRICLRLYKAVLEDMALVLANA